MGVERTTSERRRRKHTAAEWIESLKRKNEA